jgi:regulator of ribonuclease activity A
MAEAVTAQATADLVDEYGERLASIPLQLRSFGRHRRFAGSAVTVRCFEDNALLKQTLAEHPDPVGRVLVVDGAALTGRPWSAI